MIGQVRAKLADLIDLHMSPLGLAAMDGLRLEPGQSVLDIARIPRIPRSLSGLGQEGRPRQTCHRRITGPKPIRHQGTQDERGQRAGEA